MYVDQKLGPPTHCRTYENPGFIFVVWRWCPDYVPMYEPMYEFLLGKFKYSINLGFINLTNLKHVNSNYIHLNDK